MLNQAYLPFGFSPCLQHGFPLAYLFWWEHFGLYLGHGYGIQNAQRSSKKHIHAKEEKKKPEISTRYSKKKGTFTSFSFQPKAHFLINQWCETSVMFIIFLHLVWALENSSFFHWKKPDWIAFLHEYISGWLVYFYTEFNGIQFGFVHLTFFK